MSDREKIKTTALANEQSATSAGRGATGAAQTTVLDSEQAATVSPPAAIVRVTVGPDTGKGAQIALERLSVGTHPSCGLILTDPTVSRFHFDIRFTTEGLLLSDLGSTNGTIVSGLRVKSVFVESGTQLRAGRTTLEIASPSKSIEVSVSPEPRLGALVGCSVAMRRLFVAISRVAQHNIPVLIQGETGTGKEVVAREIHAQSARKGGPFVVVDCGSIPSDLAESELFGHAKGAYSGATSDRRGAFESADGGTLFLDEIGEIDLEIQPRLLRAVEAKEVKRVGSDAYRSVDVRVIAATHRDLRVAVNQRVFREDLYYRLAVATLHVPPLRERVEDIPLLLAHFYSEAVRAGELATEMPPLAVDEAARLASLPWNGNCRQLRNYVDQRLVFGDAAMGAHLSPSDARSPETAATEASKAGSPMIPIRSNVDYREARSGCLDDFEREYIAARLRRADGNVSRAAREMGIDRVYVMRLMKRHGIK